MCAPLNVKKQTSCCRSVCSVDAEGVELIDRLPESRLVVRLDVHATSVCVQLDHLVDEWMVTAVRFHLKSEVLASTSTERVLSQVYSEVRSELRMVATHYLQSLKRHVKRVLENPDVLGKSKHLLRLVFSSVAHVVESL